MTLFTAFPMAVAVATSLTLQTHAFEPNGAIFSNVNSVQDLSPHIVWQRLSICANLPVLVNPPEGEDCLIETFLNNKFPGGVWGNLCSPPDDSLESITLDLEDAADQCPDFNNDMFVGVEAYLVNSVLMADSCWAELCERDDIVLQIESEHMETCAGVELPYPYPIDDGMFVNEEDNEEALVTCMLDYVMETPASEFGLEEPSSSCYPPGHQNMNAVCETLALKAYEQCIDSPSFVFEEDMMMSMSFDYSMSMNMDQEPADGLNYFDVMDKFCDILELVSMDGGLDCLDQICDSTIKLSATPSQTPGTAPSPAPSSQPSLMASATPSAAPSLNPSTAPSSTPTLKPSVEPTASPSLPPSAAPSLGPSMAPSAEPSMGDSVIITNPEVVDSSAVDVSTAAILTLFGLVFPIVML